MSTKGEVFCHPLNGSTEQTWDGFSWPAFFFGALWLLVKGLWAHFVINAVILLATAGFAAPIIWIVYGFIGNAAHRSSLLKKGYLTEEQWNQPKKKTDISIELDDIRALVANKGKIGLSISISDARTIESVSINSTAFLAGIKTGDRLIMIDGELCNGGIGEIALKLAGKAGSKVALTIRRDNEALDFVLVRE